MKNLFGMDTMTGNICCSIPDDSYDANYDPNRCGFNDIPRIMTKPTDKLYYPLDKVNANIWRRFGNWGETGQLMIGMEKRGSKREANVVFEITPSDLVLSAYDKRLYIAVSALFNSGNKMISPSQIYAKMGNAGRPSQKIIEKINASIFKMRQLNLVLNNENELQVNTGYSHFDYCGPLLPFESGNAYINNVYCTSAIYLDREPPLISFARERRQITTLPLELFRSPISKTNQNLYIGLHP